MTMQILEYKPMLVGSNITGSVVTCFIYFTLGAALVNFTEDCPKHILTPYLQGLMGKLEAILSAKFKELVEKGTKLVLEQVVTTIASVADTAEKEFIDYYDRLMPCLKYIIQNANKDEFKLLRGKQTSHSLTVGVVKLIFI